MLRRISQARRTSYVLAFLSLILPAGASGQGVTVSGIVVDGGGATPIPGAVVRLSGLLPTETDAAGRFSLGGVPPGNYTASVEAFGYVDASMAVTILRDTTLRFELAPAPLALDSIVVSGATVTIRGNLRDGTSGNRIYPAAQITVYPEGETIGANSGSFRLPPVPVGSKVTFVVEAIEYLPARVDVVAGRDTTVEVNLMVDSVALRMIQQQVGRIAVRAQSVPYAVRDVDRDELRASGAPTLGQYLERRFPRNLPSECIFVDDTYRQIEDVLYLPTGEVARVEVFGSRGRMLRVYTKKYVARLMGVRRLSSIVYIEGLGRPMCR